MPTWLGVLVAFLWSPFKYLFGVASIFLTEGISPIVGFLITLSGSMLGVFIYVYAGEWVIEKLAAKNKNKKVFSKSTRRLVKIKRSGGLVGIAILTPVLLSIPIGCFLAVTMEHHRFRIIRMMFYSIVSWGILVFGLKAFFGFDITQILGTKV